MDPVTSGGLLAPLFIAMDLFSLRYWKPSTWSKPDLLVLVPGLAVGIGVGYVLFRVLDHRAIAIAMVAVTRMFVGLWLLSTWRRSRAAATLVIQGCHRWLDAGHYHHGRPLWWAAVGDVLATAWP
jgi:uncharacterized membrane protein YfcA